MGKGPSCSNKTERMPINSALSTKKTGVCKDLNGWLDQIRKTNTLAHPPLVLFQKIERTNFWLISRRSEHQRSVLSQNYGASLARSFPSALFSQVEGI